jgi:hypothetical protein
VKIAISSRWFPACVALYLDRAARRMGHVVTRCGPTSGEFTGWPDCGEQQNAVGWGVRVDIPPMPDGEPRHVALEDLSYSTDLWIDVDGSYFCGGDLSPRRRALVVTDPHVEGMECVKQREFVDEVYVMQSPYLRPCDRWLPYGYDPEWHRSMRNVATIYDVTNLGAPYEERVAISETLTRHGKRVLGPGRGLMGPKYAEALQMAPAAIVWPLKDDLPCRVFEALACGRQVLTKNVPDLEDLAALGLALPVFVFDTAPSLLGRVIGSGELSPLSLPFDGARHTWDARLQQIIEGRPRP